MTVNPIFHSCYIKAIYEEEQHIKNVIYTSNSFYHINASLKLTCKNESFTWGCWSSSCISFQCFGRKICKHLCIFPFLLWGIHYGKRDSRKCVVINHDLSQEGDRVPNDKCATPGTTQNKECSMLNRGTLSQLISMWIKMLHKLNSAWQSTKKALNHSL